MVPKYFQGILLHPDGKIRQTGSQRGNQERGGPARLRGEWAVQSPQPSLQQKQPHWGKSELAIITVQNINYHLHFSLCLSYHPGPLNKFQPPVPRPELCDNNNNNLVLQVPHRFRWVVEQTLKEFFKAIQAGKDLDPSWKKQIYKIIARLDDYVPEYFKSQAFLEQLE